MKKLINFLGLLVLLMVVTVSAGCISDNTMPEASSVAKNFNFASGWICETTDVTLRIALVEDGTGLLLLEEKNSKPILNKLTWEEGLEDNGAKFATIIIEESSGKKRVWSLIPSSDKDRALLFTSIENLEEGIAISVNRIILDDVISEPTPVKTQTATPTPTKTTTTSQDNALKSAKSYIKYSGYSYRGLIEQLEFEGYPHSDAVYGADNCGANWKDEAVEKAKSYIKYSGFSYEGLIEQLEFEKFTHSESVYGADNCGADWNEEAVEKATSYLKYGSFSRQGLYDQLEFEGFTPSQIEYALKRTYDA